MNTYKIKHTAKCPNGELVDFYDIALRSPFSIQVEYIIQTLENAPKEIYQEDLADYLRSKIAAEITVMGWHHGVQIISERF
jgi:hypothetical protein